MNPARLACATLAIASLAVTGQPALADAALRATDFGDFTIELPRHWPATRAQNGDRPQVPENEIDTLYVAHAWAKDGEIHATLGLGIVHGPNFSQREVNDAATTPRKGIDKALEQLDWKVVAAYGKGDDPGKAQLLRRSIDIKGGTACFLFTLSVDGKQADRHGYTWWCPDGDRAIVIQAVYDKLDDAEIFLLVSQVRSSLVLQGNVATPAPQPVTALDELAKTPASMLDLGIYRLELLAQRLDFSGLAIAGTTAQATYPATSTHYPSAGPLVALQLDLQEKNGQKDNSPERTCAAALDLVRTQLHRILPQPGSLFRRAGTPPDDDRANVLAANAAGDILITATIHSSGNGKPPSGQASCEGLLAGYEALGTSPSTR